MERKLILNVVNGDPGSWQKMITDYSGYIYAAIVRYTEDYDEKMAIYLHVLEKLQENGYQKLRQFQFRSSLSTWLTVVSRNLALDYLRAQYGRDFRYKQHLLALDDAAMPPPGLINNDSPEMIMQSEENQEKQNQMKIDLKKIFAYLDDREILVLQLVFFRGIKINEVGKLLKIRSVYKFLRRTLAKAKSLLLEHSSLAASDWHLFFKGEWA